MQLPASGAEGMQFNMPEGLGTSDDFVEYWLHIELPEGESCCEAALQARAALFVRYLQRWTHTYIWQRDSFVLVPCAASAETNPGGVEPCLYGRVYWGENIDDEWFVVWLLQQLTLRWPSTVASVADNDGQFLLIEAADAIPRWLKPANAAQRVWLYRGKVHIIPLLTDKGLATAPTATTGPDLVRDPAVSTEASRATNDAIAARIATAAGFTPPTSAAPFAVLTHRARLYLPRAIIGILRLDPGLIAPAVEAFVARDPIDMRLCKKMDAGR